MNKRAEEYSTSTVVVIILSVVIIGAGLILLNKLTQAAELPSFKGLPPQFFKVYTTPEKGQSGTVFKTSIELSNTSEIYLIESRITSNNRIVYQMPLFDDGEHGDGTANDGIFANVWNSQAFSEGIYGVDIVINPSPAQLLYSNVSSIKVFNPSCEILMYNGEPGSKLDIAILPQGYSDMSKFKEDALTWIRRGVLYMEPFKSEADKINFYIINQTEDLECKRDEKISTLMYCNDRQVGRTASQCPADEIVVILDDKELCGTAGSYAKACNGQILDLVATHEFGHAFGGLGDEYSYSESYPEYKAVEAEYPNCDKEGCSKWKMIEGTKCLEGCGEDNLYRSSDKCLMKDYTRTFCSVCQNEFERLLANYKEGKTTIPESVPANKVYVIDIKYSAGKPAPSGVYATNGNFPDRKTKKEGRYSASIIAENGKKLYSFRFDAENILLPAPPLNGSEAYGPVILNKSEWSIVVPKFENAKSIDFYDKSKKIASIDVSHLSESCGNGKCEKHESSMDCAQDCNEWRKDDVCNYARNDICDPDCGRIDPDCRKSEWIMPAVIVLASIALAIIMLTASGRKKR